jgi:hypothetical protein
MRGNPAVPLVRQFVNAELACRSTVCFQRPTLHHLQCESQGGRQSSVHRKPNVSESELRIESQEAENPSTSAVPARPAPAIFRRSTPIL